MNLPKLPLLISRWQFLQISVVSFFRKYVLKKTDFKTFSLFNINVNVDDSIFGMKISYNIFMSSYFILQNLLLAVNPSNLPIQLSLLQISTWAPEQNTHVTMGTFQLGPLREVAYRLDFIQNSLQFADVRTGLPKAKCSFQIPILKK